MWCLFVRLLTTDEGTSIISRPFAVSWFTMIIEDSRNSYCKRFPSPFCRCLLILSLCEPIFYKKLWMGSHQNSILKNGLFDKFDAVTFFFIFNCRVNLAFIMWIISYNDELEYDLFQSISLSCRFSTSRRHVFSNDSIIVFGTKIYSTGQQRLTTEQWVSLWNIFLILALTEEWWKTLML